jgi:hydroxyethylthiazole kinase
MNKVTGTGCMLSVLCGAFAAVEPEPGKAAALAAAFWKVCSRRAQQASNGPGSFRTALLDAAGTLTAEEFALEAAVTEV